ncbi:phage major structural protein, partial [Lacticaseibacillus rhamnosus]
DDYRFYGRVEDQSKEFTQDQSVPDTVLNRATLILNLNIL